MLVLILAQTASFLVKLKLGSTILSVDQPLNGSQGLYPSDKIFPAQFYVGGHIISLVFCILDTIM